MASLGMTNTYEREYNDERVFATNFLGQATGALSNSLDVDWFSINIFSGSEVSVTFDVSSMTFGVWNVYWYSPSMQVLSGRNIGPSFGESTLTYPIYAFEGSGTYWLRVQATDPNFANGGNYVVTVEIPNSPPTGSAGSAAVVEDQELHGTLPFAFDSDGDQIAYSKDSSPLHGSVTVSKSGTFSYKPSANYFGTDSFVYSVSDGRGGVSRYTMSLDVSPANDAPVATDLTASGREDTALTGTLKGIDVDGKSLSYDIVSQPQHGTVSVGMAGAFTYTPTRDFNGTDKFTYTASDSSLESNIGTVSLTLAAVNDVPSLAKNIIDQDCAAGVPVEFHIAADAFSDLETPALTYTASLTNGQSLPLWLSFSTKTLAFSGTTPSSPSSLSIRVKATDSGGLSVSDDFTLHVLSSSPSAGADYLVGTNVADVIRSLAGDDIILAGDGNDTIEGGSGDDTIDGGSGIDNAVYSAQATPIKSILGWMVASAAEGTDVLTAVERLTLGDRHLALDLDGNAGSVAKILGAVFGRDAVSIESFVGIGLALLDDGITPEALVQLAINARLGPGFSQEAIVELLYGNLVGLPPSTTERDYFVALLANNALTAADLGILAAESDINCANIDLVGLEIAGLEYLPQS